jgi:hypothetical protein
MQPAVIGFQQITQANNHQHLLQVKQLVVEQTTTIGQTIIVQLQVE